jgi:hypothetical protein
VVCDARVDCCGGSSDSGGFRKRLKMCIAVEVRWTPGSPQYVTQEWIVAEVRWTPGVNDIAIIADMNGDNRGIHDRP